MQVACPLKELRRTILSEGGIAGGVSPSAPLESQVTRGFAAYLLLRLLFLAYRRIKMIRQSYC